ncbi:unnamed protein product [Cyprideis torosa]|uniref:Uncharacterized protein n=1 Tax=Cyprideis torosa TaxID=163714 RepID=A0A7R8ZU96_9CRUS|nr:unnamed protein product [Cyprideis torosa]CAG0900072.1 unnamed protein product [Cyprideis torosa]
MEPLNKYVKVEDLSAVQQCINSLYESISLGTDRDLVHLVSLWPDFFPTEDGFPDQLSFATREDSYPTKRMCLLPDDPRSRPLLMKCVTDLLQGRAEPCILSSAQKKVCCAIGIVVFFAQPDDEQVGCLTSDLWRILLEPGFFERMDIEAFTEVVLHFFVGITELVRPVEHTVFSRNPISEIAKRMLYSLVHMTVESFDMVTWTDISTRRIALLVTLNSRMCDFLWDRRLFVVGSPPALFDIKFDNLLNTLKESCKKFLSFFFKLLPGVAKYYQKKPLIFDMVCGLLRELLGYEYAIVGDKSPWHFDDVYAEALADLGSWCLQPAVPRMIPHTLLILFALIGRRKESIAIKFANNPIYPELVSVILKHLFENNPCCRIKPPKWAFQAAWRSVFVIYVDNRPNGCATLLSSKALKHIELDRKGTKREQEFEERVFLRQAMSDAVLQHSTDQEVFRLLLIHHFFLRVQKACFIKSFPHVLCQSSYQKCAMQLVQGDPLIVADLLVLTTLPKTCTECTIFQRNKWLLSKTVELFSKTGLPCLHYATRGLAYSFGRTSRSTFRTSPNMRDISRYRGFAFRQYRGSMCHYPGMFLKRLGTCVTFVCGDEETGMCTILGDRQILSSFLPYFNAMFSGNFTESGSSVISLNWLNPEIALFVFHYLHTCRLTSSNGMCIYLKNFFENHPSSTKELLEIADYLGFDEMAVDLKTHIRCLAEQNPEKIHLLFHATQGTDMEADIIPEVMQTLLSADVTSSTRTLSEFLRDDPTISSSIVNSLNLLMESQ